MSPLTRSLLALAALLAVSNAKITLVDLGLGAKCVKFIMEIPPRPMPYQPSDHGSRFTMMSDGHSQPLTVIPNKCAGYNEEVARQTVEVCNEYPTPYGPQPLPPTVQALANNVLSPVFASCGEDTECGPLLWKIEQDCRVPKCAGYNEEVARQTVVCNEYPTPYGPQPSPTTVQALAKNVLSPVFASCGEDTECGPLL